MKERVNLCKSNLAGKKCFIQYKFCYEDEATGELSLIMEPVHYPTVKEYIESYGFLDEYTISKLV